MSFLPNLSGLFTPVKVSILGASFVLKFNEAPTSTSCV